MAKKLTRGQAILRIVTAPNNWICNRCGNWIFAGTKCAKMGASHWCLNCLEKEVNNGKRKT